MFEEFRGVSRIERVRNKEMHTRAGIDRKLASRVDQRVLLSY